MKLLNYRNQNCVFHIIGIGGIGMSAIAQIMHQNGMIVQGSDIAENHNIKKLKEKGIKIFIGHSPSNIANADYIILSSAIKDSNEELLSARERSKIIIKRYEILAEIMRSKIGISISGTHGKTTTSSMVASIFEEADIDPTVITGGIINTKDTNSYVGKGDFIIVEADESDATFVKIPSQVVVITNIEPEHLDFYGTFDKLLEDFRNFVSNLPFYGFAVVCNDDDNTRSLIQHIHNKKIITYGIESQDSQIVASNIESFPEYSIFDVEDKGSNRKIHGVKLSISGKHNVLNALAAIAIGFEMKFSDLVIKNAMEKFLGVKRRFTKVGSFCGASIIDDYAHHPTEILATLDNAKNYIKNTSGRVIGVFQPHRYSRIESLMQEFSLSFFYCDILYITDIYAAGENAIEGIDSGKLIDMLLNKGMHQVYKIDNIDNLALDLKSRIRLGEEDLIVFMGAGDITKWAYMLCEK